MATCNSVRGRTEAGDTRLGRLGVAFGVCEHRDELWTRAGIEDQDAQACNLWGSAVGADIADRSTAYCGQDSQHCAMLFKRRAVSQGGYHGN